MTAQAELGAHLATSRRGLAELAPSLPQIERWGADLRERLEGGGRLLVAGNGGSAALAHHLVGELVGRYDRERRAFSALALTAEVRASPRSGTTTASTSASPARSRPTAAPGTCSSG